MDKVVEVQQQVKNNASDLSAYMRDLENWTQQMEAKDQQLIQAKKDRKANLTEKKCKIAPMLQVEESLYTRTGAQLCSL